MHRSLCGNQRLCITHAARGDVSPQYDWEVELTADPMVLELEDEETGEAAFHIRVSAAEAGEFQRLVVGTAFLANRTASSADVEEVLAQVDESYGEVDCGVSFPYVLEFFQGVGCA